MKAIPENPFKRIAKFVYLLMRKFCGKVRKKHTQKVRRSEVQRSMAKKESVKEWWDQCHEKKRDAFWLTGSRGPDVWESLNITDRIFPGQVVLNIGVGLGYCTRELVRRGCVVHVLDISEVAVNNVKDIVSGTWLASYLMDLPVDTFDLAISNLVAQHMCNKDLLEQMQAVLRGLKPYGIFAMQFAWPSNGKIPLTNEDEQSMKGGGVLRTIELFQELVDEAGGRIVWSKQIGCFHEYGSGWYGVHIERLK